MRSFLQGKKSLAVQSLRLPPGLASSHPASCAGAPREGRPAASPGGAENRGSPHVEVVKEGDKVVRLIVTCSCGERVEVECLYPTGS